METPSDLSKRRKVIYVTHARLIRLLLSHKIFARHVVVPQPQGLPETAAIVSMFVAPERNAYGMVICDPSFETVEEGLAPPELTIDWITVEIQRPEGKEKP